jgi:lipopolysaccharide/colanic/teichoic acid biosynthesis glycosyltransferase
VTVHYSKITTSGFEAEAGAASSGKQSVYRAFLKRFLDVVAVLVFAPILIPFFALVSLLIATDGHAPFFRQERVGKDGKRFGMWKFRTMAPNAERALAEHLDANPSARAEWDRNQKLKSDPRITTVGRILRRTSVDELPQIFNVLAGDMSLVGPRPMMPCQQALYPGHAYYRLRPGLTGSWQVSERHTSTFAERAVYDDDYEGRLSFATDAAILMRTIGVVLRCTGA